MFQKESVPFAPALVESMRSLGYSFQTAIADLIDNSISAEAKEINIFLTAAPNPRLIILDDGYGMSDGELEEAMRYGSRNPLDERANNDLGRFGLGLKSASLSQCRNLTVVSKKNGILSCYAWRIDHVIKTGSWSLLGYENDEVDKIPQATLLKSYKHGTLIMLEDFDRIAVSTDNINDTLTKYLDLTIDHLALVFHRFLDKGLEIKVNNRRIEPRDPFLTHNMSTQLKREQNFTIDGSIITVKPFILPHISKLTDEDIRMVGGKDALRSEQGFYIYRNKRLIIWGTWFRLERKEELSKLARVMVDIPNSLDYMWSIDIKKSTANLPDIIKKNLYNCVYESILTSETVHTYRGRKVNSSEDIDFIWERIKTREGYQYKINRNIPILRLLKKSLSNGQYNNVEELISLIEQAFPSSSVYLDVSKGRLVEEANTETEIMYRKIMEQVDTAKSLGISIKDLLEAFKKTEPYCLDKALIKLINEELEKYE